MSDMLEKCFMESIVAAFEQMVREEDLSPEEKHTIVRRLGAKWYQAKSIEGARKALKSYLDNEKQRPDRVFQLVQSAFLLLGDFIPIILLSRQQSSFPELEELLPSTEEMLVRMRIVYLTGLLDSIFDDDELGILHLKNSFVAKELDKKSDSSLDMIYKHMSKNNNRDF